jgi:hypothetical protein
VTGEGGWHMAAGINRRHRLGTHSSPCRVEHTEASHLHERVAIDFTL